MPTEIFDEGDADEFDEGPARSADGNLIEEIMITSQARNTHDDQSISETSFSASDLKAMRIQDISDIARFTPGLEINTAFAASNPTLFIRGIGLKDYNANAAGAVPIFFDGMAINSPAGQLFQLFDVKNVTVLKGPQSGRWGRNATAGAIIVDSNLPDGEFSSTGALTYGSYNDVEIEGAMGFPIIEDKLSGRLAFSYQQRDGYTRNGCSGWNPEAAGYGEKSQAATTELYTDLAPESSPRDFWKRPGQQGNQRSLYAWGNTALAEQLSDSGSPSTGKNPWYDANSDAYYVQQNGFAQAYATDPRCVLDSPGIVVTPAGEQFKIDRGLTPVSAGTFEAFPNSATFEDFQSLKPYTNNALNWAARGMLLYNPTDDVEVLLSFHGGQNLSDSAHLQMVPAISPNIPANQISACDSLNPSNTPCPYPEILEEPYFREPTAAGALGPWNESFGGVRGEPLIEIPGILQSGNSSEPGHRGSDPYLGFYDRDGQELLDVWGASLIGRWDEGRFTLHSLTGYEGNQRLVEDEGDATPKRLLYANWSDSSWQVSQEFNVEVVNHDDFSWQAGFYGLYEKVDALNTFNGALQRNNSQRFDQTLNSLAAYASGHYDIINDRNSFPGVELLRLSGALRGSRDHKFFYLESTLTCDDCDVAEIVRPESQAATWSGFTGDVMLSWNPIVRDSYDITLHAKFSHGIKNGHFNASLTNNPNPCLPSEPDCFQEPLLEPVKPEAINALEVGFDSSWMEKRILLSAAFYRYWYKNLQVFDLVNEAGAIPTQQLLNAQSTNVYGVEADLEIFPVEGLMLGFGINWLDSTFGNFVVTKQQAGRNTQRANLAFNYAGNSTIAAPEFTLNGTAEYLYLIPNWGTVNPRIDYSYQTQVYLDPQGLELISMPAYWYLDLRLAFRTLDDNIEVAFWMTNVTEQEYLVDAFDVTQEADLILQVWGQPRMMGVTVSYYY
ncbi:MAG: TonB-dependent receptor [Myxococcota bacterium]|nr:TonB-dependent receptor [Myxococcota bacterium]